LVNRVLIDFVLTENVFKFLDSPVLFLKESLLYTRQDAKPDKGFSHSDFITKFAKLCRR